MKKFLLLPVLVFFASCSTDDSALTTVQENNLAATDYKSADATISTTCLDAVGGSLTVNLSQGINNPMLVFTASLTGVSSGINYKARIEIQEISDCEDINSAMGNIVSFSSPYAVKAPTTQVNITIAGQALPDFTCYRWRVAVDCVSTTKGRGPCTTVSPWYEAPLF